MPKPCTARTLRNSKPQPGARTGRGSRPRARARKPYASPTRMTACEAGCRSSRSLAAGGGSTKDAFMDEPHDDWKEDDDECAGKDARHQWEQHLDRRLEGHRFGAQEAFRAPLL